MASTSLEYDERDRVSSFTANGHHRELTYDGEYGVSSILDYENGAESPFGERYTYDNLGRLVSVTSASDGTRYLRNIYDDGAGGTGETGAAGAEMPPLCCDLNSGGSSGPMVLAIRESIPGTRA